MVCKAPLGRDRGKDGIRNVMGLGIAPCTKAEGMGPYNAAASVMFGSLTEEIYCAYHSFTFLSARPSESANLNLRL